MMKTMYRWVIARVSSGVETRSWEVLMTRQTGADEDCDTDIIQRS